MTTTADHYDPAPARPPLTTPRSGSPTRHRRAARPGVQQVRPGHLRRQAGAPDQRLLQPARRGSRSTSARWWSPACRRSRSRSRCARSTATFSSTPRASNRAVAGLTMSPKRIIVGVAGGIAAYKACSLVRQLSEAGHEVQVIPTESASSSSAPPRSRRCPPLRAPGFSRTSPDVPHVRLGQEADLVVVAPATADLLAQAAAGRADDLLTATLLTARCPVLFAPAMHTEMWLHPATADNVATLRRRGRWCWSPRRAV